MLFVNKEVAETWSLFLKFAKPFVDVNTRRRLVNVTVQRALSQR